MLPLDPETESVVQSQGAGPSDGLREPKEEERDNVKATTTVASKRREVHMPLPLGNLILKIYKHTNTLCISFLSVGFQIRNLGVNSYYLRVPC